MAHDDISTEFVDTLVSEMLSVETTGDTAVEAELAAAVEAEDPVKVSIEDLSTKIYQQVATMPAVTLDEAFSSIYAIRALAEQHHERRVDFAAAWVEWPSGSPFARVWITLTSREKFFTDVRGPRDGLFARLDNLGAKNG